IHAWRTDGIFQVAMSAEQDEKSKRAFESNRRFFGMHMATKTRCVSDLTYSGYIASGEEITAGEADLSETFTVCPDIPRHDPRVRAGWPCYGPVPWPGREFQPSVTALMDELGRIGDQLLMLTALGLGLPDAGALTALTRKGWHHMRILHYPP